MLVGRAIAVLGIAVVAAAAAIATVRATVATPSDRDAAARTARTRSHAPDSVPRNVAMPTADAARMPGARATSDADRDRIAHIDAALSAAARWMIRAQSSDGAWRSQVYGCFRDGPTLTPYVMSCLFFLPQGGDDARSAFRKGVDHLAGMVGDDGVLRVGPRELTFPVYTAAMASRVIVLEERSPRTLRAQAAWLAYLEERRLGPALGWRPTDREFGGWGFSIVVPRKPGPGEDRPTFCESNLSATLFGLAALHSAKCPQDDPVYDEVLVFVRRCQNFADEPDRADPQFDDGGFFFIPDDPVQNKAGIAGTDRFGRERYRSYGTMTADGVRALLRCGLPADHPRVVAARRWLERSFRADTNPGVFAPDREVLRDATYYYWVWAVAHAFVATGTREIDTDRGRANWAAALADEVLRRGRPDGSWVNRYSDAKEDDPLVATPWAAAALALCRWSLTGEFATLAPRPTPDAGSAGRARYRR